MHANDVVPRQCLFCYIYFLLACIIMFVGKDRKNKTVDSFLANEHGIIIYESKALTILLLEPSKDSSKVYILSINEAFNGTSKCKELDISPKQFEDLQHSLNNGISKH